MEERIGPGENLTEGAYDPEMTETDEANAPDETGPTVGHDGDEAPDQEEIGI